MIAREAVLGDAEVAELLRTRFVPIAIDNVDHPNMTPAEKAFFKPRFDACTQGMFVATPEGEMLARGGGFEAPGVRKMLRQALEKFKAPAVPFAVPADPDLASRRRPPEGGLVLHASWKVLGLEKPEGSSTTGSGKYDVLFQHALGVDRVWVRKDEAEALVAGSFPASLRKRIVKYFVSYAVAGKVADLEVGLKDGRIEGSFRSDKGDAGSLRGVVEAKDGKVTRFDLVLKGVAERVSDCGFSASLGVIPTGARVPVGMALTLADLREDFTLILPHRGKDEGYLK